MAQPEQVLTQCSVVVDAGKIAAVLPTDEAKRRFNATTEYHLPDYVLMPGLVNTHGHGAMSLLRGFADDLPLQEWLSDHIWPTEERWVGEEFVRDGTELAMAEMLLSGTTCFSDMYFFPDQVAACARKAGMKTQVAFPVVEFPSSWARTAEQYIHKGLELYDEYKTDALVDIAFGPHAIYTVSDDTLIKVISLTGELDTAIQIHLHETAQEIADAVGKDGCRPLEKLHRLGALSPQTQCVHMTQISDADIELLVHTGAHVLHCPQSNMKLASGFCPTAQLLDNGINVALGTDGAASNNSLNLFAAMNLAALIAKGFSGDPATLNANQALTMATINGARGLGRGEEMGSIEVGKAADLITIDMATIQTQPLYNPLSQLVNSDCSRRVSNVWVDGQLLVADGELQTLSQAEIINKARYWQSKIAGA